MSQDDLLTGRKERRKTLLVPCPACGKLATPPVCGWCNRSQQQECPRKVLDKCERKA